MIADTRDRQLSVNLRGNVGARYFVEDRLGFGFIFMLPGEV